jgi:hypothetical protein
LEHIVIEDKRLDSLPLTIIGRFVVPLKRRLVAMLTVGGIAIGLGWNLGAQQAAAPQITPAEFAVYDPASKATDAKARIPLLDKWKQEFPKSEFADVRDDMYLVTYQQLNDCRHSIDMAVQIRAKRPNDFQSINAVLTCIFKMPQPNAADLKTAKDTAKYVQGNANAIFVPANKGIITDAQWATLPKTYQLLAQQTLAWIPTQPPTKNNEEAEVEITKFLTMDGTQGQFSYLLAQAQLAQAKQNQSKAVPAIFNAARAAIYDGPNAYPAAARAQVLDFVTRTYTTYHGSKDGLNDVLALAKTNALPPAGFTIKDVNTINKEKSDAAAAIAAAHPDTTFWKESMRDLLTGPDGQMVFDMTFKDVELPGMAIPGVPMFKGKIVSMTPMEKPKEIVLAVYDPNVADAKLVFKTALPGTMPVGQELSFSGQLQSFTKEPFMITFLIDDPAKQLSGWTGVNAKATKAPAGKAGAKGGAAKGGAKGKGK